MSGLYCGALSLPLLVQDFTYPLLRGESPDRPDPTKKKF